MGVILGGFGAAAGVLYGERPIKLAIKEERVDDGGHVELASIEIV